MIAAPSPLTGSPPPPQILPVVYMTFFKWTPMQTVTYARRFVAKVKDHPLLVGTWTKWSRSPEQLLQKCDMVEAADLAAESKEVAKVAERNALHYELKQDLTYAHMHVEMVTESNPATLQSLGVKTKPVLTRKSPNGGVLIDLAPVLTVTHSKGKSGYLQCKSTRPKGAAGIHLQITEDPSNEENWRDVDTFMNLTFQVGNCVPGKTYYLRAQGKGRNGEAGPFSHIVTIISL